MQMHSGDIPRAEVVDNPVPTINEGIPGMTFHRQTKALIGIYLDQAEPTHLGTKIKSGLVATHNNSLD